MNATHLTFRFSQWSMPLGIVLFLITAHPANAGIWTIPPEQEQDSARRENHSPPPPLDKPQSESDESSPDAERDESGGPRDFDDRSDRRRRGEARRGEHRRRGGSPRDDDGPGHRRPRAPRGRDGRFRGANDHRRPREFTQEEIDRAMHILRMELPEWYGRLVEMREYSPQRFHRAVRKFLPMTHEYISMRETDPRLAQSIIEEFKIEGELRELSRRYRDTLDRSAERGELDERIDRLVHEQFEMRMRRREARMHKLEMRLKEQMDRLQHEQRRFQEDHQRVEEMIARRIEQVKHGNLREPQFLSRDHRGDRPRGPKDKGHRRGNRRQHPRGRR